MSKQKKKRNKKYTPKDGAIPIQPIVHRYVAEEEQRRGQFKKWRRWAIVIVVAIAILLLVLWLVLR